MDMNFEIKHDADNSEFNVLIEGQKAFIQYEKHNGTVMDVLMTNVPFQLRGKGVGTALIKSVMDYAKEFNFSIIPTCPFVEEYMKKEKEGLVSNS